MSFQIAPWYFPSSL